MTFSVYGYGRDIGEHFTPPAEQKRLVRAAYERLADTDPKWNGSVYEGWFEDEYRRKPPDLSLRPYGKNLFYMAEKGDIILAAEYRAIFSKITDVFWAFKLIKEKGIEVRCLDLPFPITAGMTEESFQVVDLIEGIHKTYRDYLSKKVREVRRAKGFVVNASTVIGWKIVCCIVDGKRRSFYQKDAMVRKLMQSILEKQAELGGDDAKLFRWCNTHGWFLNGKAWAKQVFYRHLAAARSGFPLPNGRLSAPPIPADAKPIPTIE